MSPLLLRNGTAPPIKIASCPNRYVGREVVEIVDLIQFADKGTLPAAGGLLNQTTSFRDAWRAFRYAMSAIKAEDNG